jgi:drug/metabolite transporter (DMT)-like permease
MEKITKIKQLTLKIFFFIVINDLLDTAAQLLMKKGIGQLFNFNNYDFILFWMGLIIYLFNFFLWMNILSKVDLSVALPMASSSYILIPVAAIFFLHEFVSPLRWLGLVLIVLGIYFISQDKTLRVRT